MPSASQRVLVTYAAPAVFLSTDHWKQLYAALLSQLPLRNIHWKSPSRPTIRTIQELDVKFVASESFRDEPSSQVPQTLLEKPLLNLYIVACEDNETYKNSVKRQIRDWHASVSQRKNQEWLIIHIVRPEGKATQGRMFQMKASVLDRIRADFNADKRDRCVQLVWATDYESPTAWAELISKVKEGILSAFDSALTQREEEVKRSEGQRQMPGWNFCTFFILKESLAMSFEGMNLFEDALQQYNELEAAFFQVLREKNLSWFGALISPNPKDDSLPLLSVAKKPYRDLILANSISVFDFRTYLLARQCNILSKLGDVVEIGSKAVTFLSNFGRRLREIDDTLPAFFVESWTYSSALSVVEQCDTWASKHQMDKAGLARFSAVKGELLDLARQQLDVIGIKVGYLPCRPPFTIPFPLERTTGSNAQEKRNSQSISCGDLLSSLHDKETFYDLYVQITNRAIELYASAGRRKFALKLHGSLAALDVHRNRLSSSFQTYKSLPAHYAPHGWTSLEAFMLTHALNVHASAKQTKDVDWIHLVLEFLKAYVEDIGKDLLTDEADRRSYVSGLFSGLVEAAEGLQSDMFQLDHPAISISVADKNARLAETRDGALVDVLVHNHLPCDLPIDEVTIIVIGREGTKLSFSEKPGALASGSTKLTLFCPSSASGTYALHSSQIKIARLVLQWKDNMISTWIKQQSVFKRLPSLVRIPKDLHALDVRLRQPPRIELGTPPCIMVIIRTGRNDISTVTLKLSAPSGIRFHFADTSLETEQDATVHSTDASVTLTDVGNGKAVVMSIPHSDASSLQFMRVNISVEYVTSAEPTITRILKLGRVVATGLPVTINVEDFFRGTRLFTRFTLSTTSHQHIRIRCTRLQPIKYDADGVKITSCLSQKPAIVTITPNQPGKFLFQLDSARGQGRESLQLQIEYRMLREEVESLVDLSVQQVLLESPSLEPHCDELIDKVIQALEGDAKWIELYSITGELVVPGLPDEEGEVGAALHRLKEILSMDRSGQFTFGEWREVIIPVDVPRMHILAAARLQILPNPFSTVSVGKVPRLFAGQPISAVVSVTTSFHWAPAEDSNNETYHLRYDIEEMTQDWLVCGRKRGDFIAKDGQTFTIAITLIALHHGELALPKVGITALPIPGEMRMRSMVLPSCETYQLHGAERVLVSPRGGRSTFVVSMGQEGVVA
ncbi:hypothetical protein SCP_0404120 [Sparassis crispa]|uniref:Trafficking protein particle complex subunit 10 n=1 Tax=Sparassis crispa TaxID=139825 RepID=A0A401GIM5_9APHY|nr:hypothetical protein SCP_0404120 [Sparassis crispa]GBE82036.1 hypothetical protein SCP_0404120 [Sparassis crispa]